MHMCEVDIGHCANPNLSGDVAKCWYLRFVVPDRTSMCFCIATLTYVYVNPVMYRNPDLDDRIYECLLTSVAAVQAEDVRASFLFMGDLNGHHQEWLGSTTTTNSHGVAALDFALCSDVISW